LTKISIFIQKFRYLAKISIFKPKFRFLTKVLKSYGHVYFIIFPRSLNRTKTISPKRASKSKRRSMLNELQLSPTKQIRRSISHKEAVEQLDLENIPILAETEIVLKNGDQNDFASPERTSPDEVITLKKSPIRNSKSSKRRTRKLTRLQDLTASFNNPDKCEMMESSPEKSTVRSSRRRTRLSAESFKENSHKHIKAGPVRTDIPSLVVKYVQN